MLIDNALLMNIIHHQVLTKDSVTVSVDAVVYYRVSNATVKCEFIYFSLLTDFV